MNPSDPRGGAGMRLAGLVRKEFLQIVRDPSSIAIAFVMPIFLLVLFGYGVSLDADHVPVALVAESPSADTADFFASLEASHYFAPIRMNGMAEADAALRQGRVSAIVHLRENFAERLRRPDGAPIQVIVNGVDANTARLAQGYVTGAWGAWLTRWAGQRGMDLNTPVRLEQRVWFNSELRSRNYLVPGLVAIIMTLIGALLTALVMAREWERGTMEALLVTPATMSEILLGKLFAYFILGTGGMLLTVGLAVGLFEVPLRGSFWVLWVCASLFLLAALGMGLTISTWRATSSWPARSPSSPPSCPPSCSPVSSSTSTACRPGSRWSPTPSSPAISSPSSRPCSWPATSGRWCCPTHWPWC